MGWSPERSAWYPHLSRPARTQAHACQSRAPGTGCAPWAQSEAPVATLPRRRAAGPSSTASPGATSCLLDTLLNHHSLAAETPVPGPGASRQPRPLSLLPGVLGGKGS